MSLPSDADPIARVARTGQLIVVALTSAVVSYLVVVLVLRSGGGRALPPGSDLPVPTCAALALGAAIVPISMFLPGRVIARERRRILGGPRLKASERERALLPLFQTSLVVGATLLVTAGLLALVAYMVDGSPLSLFLALLLILALAARLPTRRGIERWLEEELKRPDEGA